MFLFLLVSFSDIVKGKENPHGEILEKHYILVTFRLLQLM